MYATLVAAVVCVGLWAFLLAVAPPSGWLHLPLAIGTTLLVRWIALRGEAAVSGAAPRLGQPGHDLAVKPRSGAVTPPQISQFERTTPDRCPAKA